MSASARHADPKMIYAIEANNLCSFQFPCVNHYPTIQIQRYLTSIPDRSLSSFHDEPVKSDH